MPLDMASTPVIAEQPEANAVRIRNMPTCWSIAQPLLFGWVNEGERRQKPARGDGVYKTDQDHEHKGAYEQVGRSREDRSRLLDAPQVHEHDDQDKEHSQAY